MAAKRRSNRKSASYSRTKPSRKKSARSEPAHQAMRASIQACKVTDQEGREYSLHVRPYRAIDNKIDGAVITLVDLQGRKESYAGTTPRRPK